METISLKHYFCPMKWSFALGICLLLVNNTSCGEKKKPLDPKFDDSLYEKLDENFYKNKSTGKYYIHTSMLTKTDDSKSKIVFFYQEVPTVDTGSFLRLGHGGYFAKDKQNVYTWEIKTDGEIVKVLDGADPSSFEVIGYEWAKDKSRVYHRDVVVKGLDPSHLKIVCAETEDSSTTYIHYVCDEDQLFYKETEVKVPADMDLNKLTCVEDLFGNPFISYNNHLYIVNKGALVEQQ